MEGSEKVNVEIEENRIIRCEVDADDAEILLRAVFNLDIDVLHIRIRDLDVYLRRDYVLIDNTDFTERLQALARKICCSEKMIKYQKTGRLLEALITYAKYGEEAARKIDKMVVDMIDRMVANADRIEITDKKQERVSKHIFECGIGYWEEIMIEKHRVGTEKVIQTIIDTIRNNDNIEINENDDNVKIIVY